MNPYREALNRSIKEAQRENRTNDVLALRAIGEMLPAQAVLDRAAEQVVSEEEE